MIKQSRYGKIGGVIAIVGLMVMVMAMLFNADLEINLWDAPLAEPPPMVERVYTPSECVVDVSNWTAEGQRSYGRGVVVNYGGETFVLTSHMIFTHEGYIVVNAEDATGYRVGYAASIIHQSDVWGLVALECSLLEGTPSITLNAYPNHPPGTTATVGTWGEVNTLEYINDDWVLLDGSLPAIATGMPVENRGGLVGIIVGLNRVDKTQSIMVGNRAIKEFCNQAILMDVRPPDAPPVFVPPRHHFGPPANPNMLFGNDR